LLHLALITSIGCQELGTDEQEDDMSRVERLEDFWRDPIREDVLIRPFFNHPVALELTQVCGE